MGPDEITFTPVSETQPTEQQLADLVFAWRCVKHVKSNAITIAKEQRLLGMGSGQPNRVKSVQIALEKAADDVEVRSQVTHGLWAVVFLCSGMVTRHCYKQSFGLHLTLLYKCRTAKSLNHSISLCKPDMPIDCYPDLPCLAFCSNCESKMYFPVMVRGPCHHAQSCPMLCRGQSWLVMLSSRLLGMTQWKWRVKLG